MWAMVMATAALEELDDAAAPEAVAEAEEPEERELEVAAAEEEAAAAPPAAEPEPEAVADAMDEADELVVWPDEALREPQVTDRQPVWPSRSFGWAWTQSAFHCAHSNEGTVWS